MVEILLPAYSEHWHSGQYDFRAVRLTSGALRGLASSRPEPQVLQQIVFQEYVHTVSEQTDRLRRLEAELHAAVKTWRLHSVVGAVQARRGLDLTGAVTLIADVGDLTRFDTPRKLMSYLGLTPSEYSSGTSRRQGGIT